MLDDLLGIADPAVRLPKIDPEARRRRLTTFINDMQLARRHPGVYVVEDVHWMDEASESMLADFLAVIPQSSSLVLLTYRPEYEGVLRRVPGSQTIALAPLSDSETASLTVELLGADPSVRAVGQMVAVRAAGNPFFAEEMVRELAERGVLVGMRGAYSCGTDVDEVVVPATLQATIAARIDRLSASAKRTLMAAAVIGFRFSADLLIDLGIEPQLEELIGVEIVDQVRFTEPLEYAFRHPLTHTVAYESQLKSDRAQLHRRLAAAIEGHGPESVEQNAALVAEHLEAAGDLCAAYSWHMRAAMWALNRDIAAAQLSWERARKIADALPADDPERLRLRIAPRTMLCGNAFRIRIKAASASLDELRDLCAMAGDNASLSIGMAGLVMDHLQRDRLREASQLATETMTLVERVGEPALTVGLAILPIYAKGECGEWSDVLRWSQLVVDLADGDPAKGNFFLGCPLAFALSMRANARYCLGIRGWAEDLEQSLAMARDSDPMSYAAAVAFAYSAGISAGVLRADDRILETVEEAVRIADRSSDDWALSVARMTLGVALVHRHTKAERDRGQQVLAKVSVTFRRRHYFQADLSLVKVFLAREQARNGDLDGAIPLMRAAVDHLFRDGRAPGWSTPLTGVLVETLLDRATADDLAEAEAAAERLATAGANDMALREVLLLRLRALIARARGEGETYAELRDRYRHSAELQGYEGHIEWALKMP